MRRKPRPARRSCGPRPRHVEQRLARLGTRRAASRCATIFLASDGPMPATCASSGALAVLSSTPTLFTQLSTTSSSFLREQRLVHVVLVLADADALGIDLHQLGQRILQAPRDGDRAAHREVEVGELLARDVARRVDAGARLAHRRRRTTSRQALGGEHLAHERLGLAAVRAVADRDRARRVLAGRARAACSRACSSAASPCTR